MVILIFLDYTVEANDIVLDFFAGSSTTAHAVLELSLKKPLHYLMVQLPESSEKVTDAYRAGFKTIDAIGIERILRAAEKIRGEHPETTADLGFRHFTLAEPSTETLDKLVEFDPKTGSFLQNTVLQDFGVPTILATWLVRDGYGFTASVQPVDFAGYTGYYMDKHLYLISPELKNEAIAAITEKCETDAAFNPENVVLFGYSFTWTETENLKINLARLKDTEKNLRINFDIRY